VRKVEVELCRFFELDVLPSHLVPRALSRLHPRIDRQLIWREGALLVENKNTYGLFRVERPAGVSLPGGRIVLCVRPLVNNRLAGLRLLDQMACVVQHCISLYPGVTLTELVECGQPDSCTLNIREVALSVCETNIEFNDHRALSPCSIFEHAGLIDPAPADTPASVLALSISDDLLAVLAGLNDLDPQLARVVQHQQIASYPELLFVTPHGPPSTWSTSPSFDSGARLHALCEFSLGPGQPLSHPCKGAHPRELDHHQLEHLAKQGLHHLSATLQLLQHVRALNITIASHSIPGLAKTILNQFEPES